MLLLSSEENMVVLGALLSIAGWVSLYFALCHVNGRRSSEWNCRLVTLLHGILAVSITAYIGYVDGPWPFTYPGRRSIVIVISGSQSFFTKNHRKNNLLCAAAMTHTKIREYNWPNFVFLIYNLKLTKPLTTNLTLVKVHLKIQFHLCTNAMVGM